MTSPFAAGGVGSWGAAAETAAEGLLEAGLWVCVETADEADLGKAALTLRQLASLHKPRAGRVVSAGECCRVRQAAKHSHGCGLRQEPLFFLGRQVICNTSSSSSSGDGGGRPGSGSPGGGSL
jgi:hypothetical protein